MKNPQHRSSAGENQGKCVLLLASMATVEKVFMGLGFRGRSSKPLQIGLQSLGFRGGGLGIWVQGSGFPCEDVLLRESVLYMGSWESILSLLDVVHFSLVLCFRGPWGTQEGDFSVFAHFNAPRR